MRLTRSLPLYSTCQRGGCTTMSEAWSWAVRRYGDKRLFASRDILGEEDEIQPNGKLFRKLGNKGYTLTVYFC